MTLYWLGCGLNFQMAYFNISYIKIIYKVTWNRCTYGSSCCPSYLPWTVILRQMFTCMEGQNDEHEWESKPQEKLLHGTHFVFPRCTNGSSHCPSDLLWTVILGQTFTFMEGQNDEHEWEEKRWEKLLSGTHFVFPRQLEDLLISQASNQVRFLNVLVVCEHQIKLWVKNQ